MLTVAVPVAGSVTGEGENETVEFVSRTGCACVLATAGPAAGTLIAAFGAVPGAGVAAGAGLADRLVPAAGADALRSRRVFVSEPVFRPRIFASIMFGIRKMCGVSMMMISVWSRLFCSCEKRRPMNGMSFKPGSPLSDVDSVSVMM